MDLPKYSSFVAALHDVPDPRKARGQRHAWSLILTLIVAALVSGQKNGRAMGQWVQLHAEEIATLLQLNSARLPSTATLRRALRTLEVTALEARLADYLSTLALTTPDQTIRLRSGTRLVAQAIDGKDVRGANAHGASLKLISLVAQDSGRVHAQAPLAPGQGEQTGVKDLLAQRRLEGTIVTLDAGLATRPLAQQIRAQHGHYLMVIKRNQREVYDAIAFLFEQPTGVQWLPTERAAAYRVYQTSTKGHGRLEMRRLECSPDLNAYLAWPGLGQVIRRTYRSERLKTGKVSQDVSFGLTSLGWEQVTPAELERLWRSHWTIENRAHYVRDATLGEDRCQIHVGAAPQALAALRNTLICLLRAKGWTNIADALRDYGASVKRALTLIGARHPPL